MDCLQGNAKERVNSAGPSQENAAGWRPPTCNCHDPGVVTFNNEVRSDFTSFAMSLLAAVRVEGGDSNSIQAFRTSSVMIDIIRFLGEKNAEIRRETTQNMEELRTLHRSQTAKHQQEISEIESRSMSKIQQLTLSLEGVSKELSDARAEVSGTRSRLSSAELELQDRNKFIQKSRGMTVQVAKIVQEDTNAKNMDLNIKLSHSQKAEKGKIGQ